VRRVRWSEVDAEPPVRRRQTNGPTYEQGLLLGLYLGAGLILLAEVAGYLASFAH